MILIDSITVTEACEARQVPMMMSRQRASAGEALETQSIVWSSGTHENEEHEHEGCHVDALVVVDLRLPGKRNGEGERVRMGRRRGAEWKGRICESVRLLSQPLQRNGALTSITVMVLTVSCGCCKGAQGRRGAACLEVYDDLEEAVHLDAELDSCSTPSVTRSASFSPALRINASRIKGFERRAARVIMMLGASW